MGLDEALARLSVMLSVLQEPAAVRRVASEICEDADVNPERTILALLVR